MDRNGESGDVSRFRCSEIGFLRIFGRFFRFCGWKNGLEREEGLCFWDFRCSGNQFLSYFLRIIFRFVDGRMDLKGKGSDV